jgi:tRNA modification GTPase
MLRVPMDSSVDTIFGLATASPMKQGSGIAVVRLSGPDAFEIAGRLCDPELDPQVIPDRRFMLVSLVHEGRAIDRAGLLAFHRPKSYTGEDVVEFHCHGGIAVIRALQAALEESGARPAEPGEFTRRGFLNGRYDLVQAEAVAALVGAAGEAARREALRQRSGGLSERVEAIREKLRDILARMEVDFDYPEERVDGMTSEEAVKLIEAIRAEVKPLLASWETGRLLGGIRLAIIGRPNVGKSSLLNALLDEDRAIVTPTPGTTRDVVSGSLTFGGVPAEVLDTAGIRAIAAGSDTAEAEGVRRSWREVERAHLVLLVFDVSSPLTEEDSELVSEARWRTKQPGGALLLVCNKIDLPSACEADIVGPLVGAPDLPHVAVSARTGEGLDGLRACVRELLNLEVSAEEILLTESRHRALLAESDGILQRVREDLGGEMPQDVAATELWGADRALGRLLGEGLEAGDLDEIFSRFCIGK